MTKKRRETPWIVTGPQPYLASCRRCGGKLEKPPMPAKAPPLLKYMNSFLALHEECKEPTP